jgi:hypothetical protein
MLLRNFQPCLSATPRHRDKRESADARGIVAIGLQVDPAWLVSTQADWLWAQVLDHEGACESACLPRPESLPLSPTDCCHLLLSVAGIERCVARLHHG